jgi:hypothetical protein
VPASVDVSVAHPIVLSIETNAFRRRVVHKIPLMLLARDAEDPSVNIGKAVHVFAAHEFETCRPILRMSAIRGRPEVSGARSK